jgi:hypothetical protein
VKNFKDFNLKSEFKNLELIQLQIDLCSLLDFSAENSSLISNLILSFLNSSSWKSRFSLAAGSFYQPLFLPDL